MEKTRKSKYITYIEDKKCFLKLLFQVHECVQPRVMVKGM